MQLASLRVVHDLKEAGSKRIAYHAPGAFMLDSCQRRLWIDLGGESAPYPSYRGAEAYAFLLSVATGLESQVIGETDIFGQLKEAWKQQKDQLPTELKKELNLWMQRLFEDTKEIRSLYLQNLGGSSYGSLLRKLLKDHQSLAQGPTLLIGAGQLALSVAPYLLEHELLISNRTPSRAKELAFTLQEQNPSARITALDSFEAELKALSLAAQVIICIPQDAEHDPQRIAALKDSGAHLVHLGMHAGEDASHWSHLPAFHPLDEIFQMSNSLSAIRSIQVERARAACREKATLRGLAGGSGSLAHGWEDLAVFKS